MAKGHRYTIEDLKKQGLVETSPGVFESINKGIKPAFTKVLREPYPVTPKQIKKAYDGFKQQLDEATHLGIYSSPLVVFTIEPMGAVRMTKSDQWKLDPFHKDPKKRQRKPVTRYFKFKRDIKAQAEQNGFKLPESEFHAVFIIPMPHSWSQKKKNQMNGAPHKQKPDLDNMIKAVKDSLCDEDKSVWDYRLTKYWGVAGKIIIYPISKLV